MGGSLGSPAVDIGVNISGLKCTWAGVGNLAYFLPADLLQEALGKLRKGETVTQGIIQLRWWLKQLNEYVRLGRCAEWEKKFRIDLERYNAIAACTVFAQRPWQMERLKLATSY
jgi:hypothetical protein